MALSNETMRSFRLYVTHVDGEAHFLRISGQHDQQSSLMVESLFESARENLEKGIGAVPPGSIHEGIICAAKYKDGTYYRAKIISTSSLASGLVGVHFIDFGNKDIISLSTIRYLDNYDPMLLKLPGQATDYYLSRVMHPAGRWDEPSLLKLQSLLCYTEYPSIIDAQPNRTAPLISMQFKGNDLSTHLVNSRMGVQITVAKQEALLQQLTSENQQVASWQPTFFNESTSYLEHVPFLVNQSFPSNPASAMRMQQSLSLPFNGSIPPPSLISQRLIPNKVSRNPGSLKALGRQPQQAASSVPLLTSPPPPAVAAAITKPTSPKKSTTYKSRLLEVNSQHKVFVSYAEEGPELFAVQLVTDAKKLQDMMDEINRRPHSSLKEPPMIGTVCLGRMSGDRIICRAIVMNLSGSQCKLFFVDFGDTEMVSYYDIFDIPEEFVKPNVFAMRFCLSGVKKLEKGPYLNETFKQLANGKVLSLKVVAPEGPPLIQYGELYLDNKNVLDLLMANMKDKLQFKLMGMLPPTTRQSVLVSYVDSCIKFFIQLSYQIDELNAVMEAVRVHCENTSSPGELPVGAACCARFPDDGNWYRARVINVSNGRVTVTYVDYGNEQEVDVSDLRTITPGLVELPAVALKCALKGFESHPVESKTSNQLEMLALEKTLMATIVGMLSNDTMLVSLVDESVTPPLDIAKKMMQLSQPRSNIETKATTPIRKDAVDSFSSPEGSLADDKKKFRREKSFKDDRRTPRDDDFGQRGGSFRNRDNNSFERAAPGRHSEKFRRPDNDYRPPHGRGNDRRGGPRGWEGREQPAAAEDAWDDGAASASDTNFKRKHRSSPPGPKGLPGGAGRRLRQAAEGSAPAPPRGSAVQDRLKRDNRRNQNNKDEWNEGNDSSAYSSRPPRDHRAERRDHRGDRRDNNNWGEKKDFQKRDFRENRGERGDRTRSNFSPRDRAERSFGSDQDKRSESGRSERSVGRAPPHKPRSKFTQVQYKQIANPVELSTPYIEPAVEVGAQHEVSVTWLISPENFYTQILAQQPKFLEMMHAIPELYKGVKSYTGDIPVGASVLARYPADGVLYRATIVAIQPFSKFIVRYVDFGNKQLVDAKDIWQLDQQLLELPKMAVHCALVGVAPKDGEWKADPEIDLCFNAPRYQCVFQEAGAEQYRVSLWSNGVSVADTLVDKQLAVKSDDLSSAVTLKDEAVDMSITVGQQIQCRVTHVEAFHKLYVQLDLDKAALVEKAINEFDVAKLTPLSPDSLSDGIHCTLKRDGKVYRAILRDTSDCSHVAAVLPDYGTEVVASLDDLMILPTELTVYYYQSLECKLHNYTAECKQLMTLDELKQKLTNNKFIVYINSVEEASLCGTFYDSITGQKISIFEPDEGAYEEVDPFCMKPVFNYNYGNAYITHAENLNEVYLQKASDGDRIASLLEELYKFYEEGEPQPLENYEVEQVCVAKSADGNWYRATILSVDGDDVKVQFPDYGNTETVAKDSLKKLDPKFLEPAALAIVVSLGLVALVDDAVAKLMEVSSEKEVQVTLGFGDDGWLASLHLEGVDLNRRLVSENIAMAQIRAEEQKPEVITEEVASLPPGCTQVYISHIDSPGHFWLQMADQIDKIEEIQADLKANAASYPNVETVEVNTLCVAKYSADDNWYRAEILDSDADITTVRFIDYGNTDVLDNQPGVLKAMPDALQETERFAVKASVNAIPTGTGQWSEPAADYFTQLVGDLAVPVDALIVLKDVTTYVDIYVNGHNLTDKLVAAGHASRSEVAAGDEHLPACFASHVNSPAEFWIQLEASTPELQAVEEAMVDAENFPPLESKEEGVICAAKYPEDGAWYRAQVVVDGSQGTEVLFMDYGNASIADELRALPASLQARPALSRKCALQKPRGVATWARRCEQRFAELAADGATVFSVQFIAAGDVSIVELFIDGKSVTEELVALCEDQVNAPSAAAPATLAGKICYVHSANEFYVQLDSAFADVDKVIARLAEAEQFETLPETKVGSFCAAFWSDDEHWYRAKILELDDVSYQVQFIDYGNKASCEDFRKLPEDLAQIEPLAKCCCLSGLTGDEALSEAVRNKLEELVAEDVTFQIEVLDNSEVASVRLLHDGKDVTSTVSVPDNESLESTKIIEASNDITGDADFKPESVQSSSPIPGLEKEAEILNGKVEGSEEENPVEDLETPPRPVEDKEENEHDASNPDLNESGDSSHTVIENKSFEENSNAPVESIEKTPVNTSVETVASNDTVTNDSKESADSQTGCELEKTPTEKSESPEKIPEPAENKVDSQ